MIQTHNTTLSSSLAEFVIAVDINGNVTGQDSVSSALSHDSLLASEVHEEQEMIEKEQEETNQPALDPAHTAGKLVIAEEIALSRLDKKAFNILLSALGGKHPYMFLAIWLLAAICMEATITFRTWYLGYWGLQYDNRPSSEVPAAQ